uniref:Choline transporter-like protein n=1 Tax=Dicentrarchus labrax TaxID=13489 RepID=A0A8P4G8C2_DICLA
MTPHRYTPSSSAAVQSETAAGAAPPGPYYGEPHKFDPTFRGPVRRRSCTDVLCCLIFILVILSYVALGIVAWLHGDPKKVLHPTDSYGQFCGQKGTSNAKKPILFYFNILKCTNPTILINLQCPTTQMCVSKCPDKFATYTEMQLQHKLSKSYWEYYRLFCKPGFNNPDKVPILSKHTTYYILRENLQHRVQYNNIVKVDPDTNFNGQNGVAKDWCMSKYSDLRNISVNLSKTLYFDMMFLFFPLYLCMCYRGLLLSFAVSLVFILLLRFTAGLLLWMTIITVILLLAYGMWYCSMELSQLRLRPGSDVAIIEVGLQTDLQIYLQLTQTWIILSTEASILLMLIFLRRRVRVAIALLREASKAIGHIMSTLFYPVITFLLLTVFISYWAVTAVYPSTGRMETFTFYVKCLSFRATLCLGSQCLFAFYGGETSYHQYLFLLQLSNLLVFLWLVNFSLALEQCTLAGTFASYYWARRKPQDIPPCPLFSSFSRALRYHTGSLAFGALILSVVQLIRIILEYLEQKLKGIDNSLSRFIMHCLKCCFWCLEKLIRYMNHNAYVMVAIYGKNLCTSAREAFFLLMRNVVRVAVLDRVTDFLLFLGKVLIAGGVGVIAFFFFTRKIPVIQEEVPNLNYYWVPLLTVVIGSYLIAHGFFSVYATCVDTLFLCFCDDLERNDGSSEKPFLMSPELHRILGKSISLGKLFRS